LLQDVLLSFKTQPKTDPPKFPRGLLSESKLHADDAAGPMRVQQDRRNWTFCLSHISISRDVGFGKVSTR